MTRLEVQSGEPAVVYAHIRIERLALPPDNRPHFTIEVAMAPQRPTCLATDHEHS